MIRPKREGANETQGASRGETGRRGGNHRNGQLTPFSLKIRRRSACQFRRSLREGLAQEFEECFTRTPRGIRNLSHFRRMSLKSVSFGEVAERLRNLGPIQLYRDGRAHILPAGLVSPWFSGNFVRPVMFVKVSGSKQIIRGPSVSHRVTLGPQTFLRKSLGVSGRDRPPSYHYSVRSLRSGLISSSPGETAAPF